MIITTAAFSDMCCLLCQTRIPFILQVNFFLRRWKKEEKRQNRRDLNSLTEAVIPNLFLLSSSAMSCRCCLLASREQGRSVGTLCCWACRWNQARDSHVSWLYLWMMSSTILSYISHREGGNKTVKSPAIHRALIRAQTGTRARFEVITTCKSFRRVNNKKAWNPTGTFFSSMTGFWQGTQMALCAINITYTQYLTAASAASLAA